MNTEFPAGLRLLCCMVHYFGPGGGKSSTQDPHVRRGYVERAVRACRDLAGVGDLQVSMRVCGSGPNALVPLDVSLSVQDPFFLVFATLDYVLSQAHDYDYILVLEDDIVVPTSVLRNSVLFDSASLPNEVLHPVRVEMNGVTPYCTDFSTSGEWSTQQRSFQGKRLGVHTNPHAAMFLLSREKLEYCANNTDLSLRALYDFGGFGGGMMASAFANFLRSAVLWRPYDEPMFHHVIHQDPFVPYRPTLRDRVSKMGTRYLPASVVTGIRRIKAMTFR
jgi:hypothetical protein